MKAASINDVGSMSLVSSLQCVPNYYLVSILNSELIFDYYREFINCTVNIQINDIRQIPIIIPSSQQIQELLPYFTKTMELKQLALNNIYNQEDIFQKLIVFEENINQFIKKLYGI